MKLKQLAFIGLGGFVLAGILFCELISPKDLAFAQDQETLAVLERLGRLAKETGSYHADVKTLISKKERLR